MDQNLYLKSLENKYKQEYKGKDILLVGAKDIFLSGSKSINDEVIENNINSVLKQINSITSYGINLHFLTDYNYKDLREKLGIDKEKFFYTNGDLIEKSFELSKELGLLKVVYLTKKDVTGIIYGNKEKVNYVNPNIIKKIDIPGKNGAIIIKILGLLEKNDFKRFHFVNILKNNSLYKELFTLYGDGTLVSLDYKLEVEKLKNISEEELVFLHNILKKLSEDNGFVKYKNLDYIKDNKDNFYVYKIDGASVGMFEVKKLGNFSKEIGTVVLDPNFQGAGIGARMIEKILELKESYEYKYFKFIIVTGNKNLKKILLKEQNISFIGEEILSKDKVLENRYNIMIEENKKDGKNREMFIVS